MSPIHIVNTEEVAYLTGLEGQPLRIATDRIAQELAQYPAPLNKETFRYVVGYFSIVSGHSNGTKIDRAARFASARHTRIDQRRKYTLEPYIVHPQEVAAIVATVTDDEDMISAAWTHDTIEDAGALYSEIVDLLGPRCASMVSDLTDVSKPSDGNRAVRKQLDLEHTAKASPEAKTIKLADLISNTISILNHDLNFAAVYLKEKVKLMEVLTEGHPELYRLAQNSLEAGLAKLNASRPRL